MPSNMYICDVRLDDDDDEKNAASPLYGNDNDIYAIYDF